MTVERKAALDTPVIMSQAMAIGRTVRGDAGRALADLANDAATGHLRQRIWMPAAASSTRSLWYWPTYSARYLWLRLVVEADTTATAFHSTASVELTITDGVTTILPASTAIPTGWDGTYSSGPAPGAGRFGRMTTFDGFIDLADAAFAGMLLTVPWRFQFVTVCAAGVSATIQMEELPRFAVDDSEAFGVLPSAIVHRQAIKEPVQLARIGASLEAGFDSAIRTYHQWSCDETAGTYLTTNSVAWTSLTGDEEAPGSPITYATRARTLRGALADGGRFQWCVRYRLLGAGAGDWGKVRINTGGSASPYGITLTNITGAWADSAVGTGYLATNAAAPDQYIDSMTFEACVSNGAVTLDLDARQVWEYPI